MSPDESIDLLLLETLQDLGMAGLSQICGELEGVPTAEIESALERLETAHRIDRIVPGAALYRVIR